MFMSRLGCKVDSKVLGILARTSSTDTDDPLNEVDEENVPLQEVSLFPKLSMKKSE